MGTSNPVTLRRNAAVRAQTAAVKAADTTRRHTENDLRDTQALVRDILRAKEESS